MLRRWGNPELEIRGWRRVDVEKNVKHLRQIEDILVSAISAVVLGIDAVWSKLLVYLVLLYPVESCQA